MHIFWNKNVKITSALETSPRFASGRPPTYYFCLLLQVCRVHFLRLLSSKENKISMIFCFCFFRSFRTYFSFRTVVFVDGGRKNISCPRAQGTLATPLFKQSWKMT